MNVTIIGTGYVGLVNGVCMSYQGADVTCIDIDKEKIDRLSRGESPIYEELLEPMIKYGIQNKKLHFSTDYSSVNSSTIIFICVGTPEKEDGSANLDYVYGAAKNIAENIQQNHECVVVVKSTVPVGTTDNVRRIIESVLGEHHSIHVAFNPEFLKEGVAVKDCLNPDRVVLGLRDGGNKISFEGTELRRLYENVMNVKDEKVILTDICSAEMVKYASNAMLATRISFTNEIANLCEAVGADIESVMRCVGLDSRIGPKFLKAGCGYGGSCFPKDVKALMKTAEENGQNMLILGAVDAVNEMQKDRLYDKYVEFFKDESAKRACVLGLAFKPGTDDMREAPSINLVKDLVEEGVEVVVYDPIAIDNAKKIFGDEVKYAADPYKAVEGADVVFLVTEWDELCKLNMYKVKELMHGDVFIDGRNAFYKDLMLKAGFKYDSIGR